MRIVQGVAERWETAGRKTLYARPKRKKVGGAAARRLLRRRIVQRKAG
jgi:hypothetical protein